MEVEPRQAPPQSWLSALGALGAFAAGRSASLSIRVMIGTRLAAIVLAMTNDGMLADFAVTVLTGTGVICHEFDSIVVVVQSELSSRTLNRDRPFLSWLLAWSTWTVSPLRSMIEVSCSRKQASNQATQGSLDTHEHSLRRTC
jgi:hypothetical protein